MSCFAFDVSFDVNATLEVIIKPYEAASKAISYGSIWMRSAKDQNRTGDTSIFSAVLYQLSYLGVRCHYNMFPIIRQALFLGIWESRSLRAFPKLSKMAETASQLKQAPWPRIFMIPFARIINNRILCMMKTCGWTGPSIITQVSASPFTFSSMLYALKLLIIP